MQVIPAGYGSFAASFAVDTLPRELVITMGFRNDALLTPAAANSAMTTAWFTSGKFYEPAFMSDTYTVVKRYVLLNVGGTLQSDTAVTTIPGTDSTVSPPPPNVSLIAQKHTLYAGKQYRGRTSLPPCTIDEATIDYAGQVDITTLGALSTRLAATFTSMVSQGMIPFLLHTQSTAVPTPPAPTIITNYELQPLVGTSRHRLKRS